MNMNKNVPPVAACALLLFGAVAMIAEPIGQLNTPYGAAGYILVSIAFAAWLHSLFTSK